jgi:hypothetical protein
LRTEFDADAEVWQVIIKGTDFPEEAGAAELEINQVPQKALALTAAEAVFEITSIEDLKPSGIHLFFPVGIPEGHAIVQEGFTLEPKLTSISPNEGSFRQTLITAIVHGVGTATQDVMLVDQNGADICETVEILEYSKIQCLTKLNQEIPETQISIKVGGNSYPCAAIDSNKCLYK